MTATPRRATLEVAGMTCTDCEHHVTAALEQAGAEQVSADFRRGVARFTWPEGAGSAAFAAAIRGRDAGYRVALAEAGTLGGTCVNVGCVPSKALLAAGAAYRAAGHPRFAGITTPAAPPIRGLAGAGYLTSTTALDLKHVPERLAVIGASAVGLELGQFFGHLGSAVTFLEVADRIAPFEEPEVSLALTEVLRGQGATIHAPAQVLAVERDGDARRVRASVDGTETVIDADEILVATGRRPNTAGLGLDAAGVATDTRGAVVTDERLRTANPRVWAAGDVTGAPQFVYVAAYHGALAAANALLGEDRAADLAGLPRVIFTTPPAAGAGLTEAQAEAVGYQVTTSVLPASAVPRALVNHDTAGVTKLVADATTGVLLGASVVGDGAGDVIQSAVLAVRHHITAAELGATFHPYLTTAESLKLAAQAFTRDVARLSCCAA